MPMTVDEVCIALVRVPHMKFSGTLLYLLFKISERRGLIFQFLRRIFPVAVPPASVIFLTDARFRPIGCLPF